MYYPLFIDFSDKTVLVFGGGSVGARRTKYLLDAGAKVTVVSKEFSEELKASGATLVAAEAEEHLGDIREAFLVIAATDDPDANETITRAALEAGVLVCCADDHTKGDVVFPMTALVCGHTLAYTTFGENPKLLHKVKRRIEDEFARK